MPKIHFGHCIGCDQPIRPPYLSFKVMWVHGDGGSITEWEEVDVCNDCAAKFTADDMHRLVSAEDDGEGDAETPTALEAAKMPDGGWDRETLARWRVEWPPKRWGVEIAEKRATEHG